MNLTPNATVSHWSAGYVGLPWVPGADGPDAFDCWGLVRHVQRAHYGRDLPRLVVDVRETPREQWGELRSLVQHSPWRQVHDAWSDGDILVMLNAAGLPHVGVVVARERLCVLHSCGEIDDRGFPQGVISLDPVAELGSSGFGHIDAWRFLP
jgi:cell wall-associated NlpC family hydrolase